MTTAQHTRTEPRPWYVRDKAVEEHKQAIRNGEDDDPTMKRKLTILRSIIVNLGIIGLGLYGLALGGNVTWITISALAVLAGYNGIEMSELAAFFQAYSEVQTDGSDDGGND